MGEKRYIEIVSRFVVEHWLEDWEDAEAVESWLMDHYADEIHEFISEDSISIVHKIWDNELLEKAVFVEKKNGDEITYEYVMTEPDAKYLK